MLLWTDKNSSELSGFIIKQCCCQSVFLHVAMFMLPDWFLLQLLTHSLFHTSGDFRLIVCYLWNIWFCYFCKRYLYKMARMWNLWVCALPYKMIGKLKDVLAHYGVGVCMFFKNQVVIWSPDPLTHNQYPIIFTSSSLRELIKLQSFCL